MVCSEMGWEGLRDEAAAVEPLQDVYVKLSVKDKQSTAEGSKKRTENGRRAPSSSSGSPKGTAKTRGSATDQLVQDRQGRVLDTVYTNGPINGVREGVRVGDNGADRGASSSRTSVADSDPSTAHDRQAHPGERAETARKQRTALILQKYAEFAHEKEQLEARIREMNNGTAQLREVRRELEHKLEDASSTAPQDQLRKLRGNLVRSFHRGRMIELQILSLKQRTQELESESLRLRSAPSNEHVVLKGHLLELSAAKADLMHALQVAQHTNLIRRSTTSMGKRGYRPMHRSEPPDPFLNESFQTTPDTTTYQAKPRIRNANVSLDNNVAVSERRRSADIAELDLERRPPAGMSPSGLRRRRGGRSRKVSSSRHDSTDAGYPSLALLEEDTYEELVRCFSDYCGRLEVEEARLREQLDVTTTELSRTGSQLGRKTVKTFDCSSERYAAVEFERRTAKASSSTFFTGRDSAAMGARR